MFYHNSRFNTAIGAAPRRISNTRYISLCCRPLFLESLEDRRLLDAGGTEMNQAVELFSASPALFVENQGQWEDSSVKYAFHGSGANVLHTDNGLVFQLFQQQSQQPADTDPPVDPSAPPDEPVLQMAEFSATFDGANDVAPIGLDRADTFHNYHIGEPMDWQTGVETYETVAYPGLYNGVDLYTRSQRDSLKYEFRVAPGADYRQISVSYEGIVGISIGNDGSLQVATELGELVDEAPFIYQVIDGEQVEVAGAFQLIDTNTFSFTVSGTYDSAVELVIDPTLDWSTYLGGSSSELGLDIAVDASGNVLVTGETRTNGWVAGGFDTTYNGRGDAFVAKISSTGAHIWSTYYGGRNRDRPQGIAVDASGNALVTGQTYSGDDIWVVKLSSTGTYIWSTSIGGAGSESASDITVDASGGVLVTGSTRSVGWVSGGFDTSYNGVSDAFVAKLSSNGGHIWSTYIGGTSGDYAQDVAVDASGNVVVTGGTYSNGWASGGFDTSHNGNLDAFVVKLSGAGDHLWSTHLGASSWDYGRAIDVDASGNVFVTGDSWSGGWAAGGFDTIYDGGGDGFLVKLSSAGAHEWSTYLGGTSREESHGVAVDEYGNALLTGATSSIGWVSGGFETNYIGGQLDVFVAKVASTGAHVWSSYLGGTEWEYGFDIAVDASGNAFVTGETVSSGWVSGGFDTSWGGGNDAFVAKITDNQAPTADANGPYSADEGGLLTLDASASFDPDGDTLSYAWDFDNDGEYDDATGVAPIFSAVGLDGPSSTSVGLRVTDAFGLSSDTNATINIVNVPPTVIITGASSADEGQTKSYNFSTIDPGNDSISLQSQNCGAGGILSNDTFDGTTGTGSFDCTFADGPAVTTVSVSVSDDDGDIGSNTTGLITFEYHGVVERFVISGTGQPLDGSIVVGTPVTVRYTFVSTAPDNAPDDPTEGLYSGSGLSGVSLVATVGNYTLTSVYGIEVLNDSAATGADRYRLRPAVGSNHGVFTNGTDTYDVPFGGGNVGFFWFMSLFNSDGTPFTSDAIPLLPPNPVDFALRELFLVPGHFGDDETIIIATLDISSVVPTSFQVDVRNVAPTFELGGDETLEPPVAGVFSRNAIAFTDPGADVWTGTVNFGDGTGDFPMTVDQLDKTFDLAHVFSTEGTFMVNVTLDDGDGGSHSDSFLVTVNLNTPPVADASGPYSGDEGAAISLSGASASDADGDPLTISWAVDAPAVCSFSDPTTLNPELTCDDNGSYTVTLTVDDGTAAPVSDEATVTVGNVPPSAIFANDGPVDEGTSFNLSLASPFDPSGADSAAGFEYAFDCGDGGGLGTFSSSSTVVCNTDDNGVRAVKGQIRDKDGGTTEYTANVTVNNVAPTVDSITVPTAPINIGDQSGNTIDVIFNDPAGTNDNSYTCEFDMIFDGTTFTPDQTVTGVTYNTCSATLNYLEAGVYTVKVIVTDKDGDPGMAEATEFIVIYDPTGGFVTGGGWIDSPPEACSFADCTDETVGKASFGFVSKYKKGASVPTGQTEFQFKAGDLNFHSSSYNWLVIANHKAMYTGDGTINGEGDYSFHLSAIDAALTPSTDVDLFRMQIWNNGSAGGLVYDNKVGETDPNGDPTTAIGGGNIKIHKAQAAQAAAVTPGDANFDGLVDFEDFLILADNFGSRDAFFGDGDFDGNGIVQFSDFLILANQFSVAPDVTSTIVFARDNSTVIDSTFDEQESESDWWLDDEFRLGLVL